MRKVTIFFQIFLLLVEINFSSKIEGSEASEKKPDGHLIKTHSDKFFLQQPGTKKTDKDKERKDKKKRKKAGREDYNLLCMIGLCGGGGGGSKVELSQLLNGKSRRSEICQKSKGYLSKTGTVALFCKKHCLDLSR